MYKIRRNFGMENMFLWFFILDLNMAAARCIAWGEGQVQK
ncbi:hypothetical protein SB48_HM08orf01343 [Heyndrickxia coagulans]|uniref:Uncharacterized protein n=1 Tax=Heyndrickxia coagulans TaxID=1398 RepID=A0AAN0T2P8_HEYCO|nr:hypothetical protein SB48_HM08orf01343 [Heyndrickxia coagulans]